MTKEAIKFTSGKVLVQSVIDSTETIGDLNTPFTKEELNLHHFNKMNSEIIDVRLVYRKKCAKIEAALQILFRGSTKGYRKFARSEFSIVKGILESALSLYTIKPSQIAYERLSYALNGIKDTFYGANYVLRCMKAICEDEETPEISEKKRALIGAHWLKAVEKVCKMDRDTLETISDEVQSLTKELNESKEWHPLKGD